MFVLAIYPFGKYSTIFQFSEDETRPFYGNGHMFSIAGNCLRYTDFVAYSNTNIRAV